ncbi:hypothetical protein EDD22DRAFT_887385 [Suillus occidentalis]|nr:hypothetical protein EDD22DRAFT_887385 [Suillus occidentalis]
MMQHQALLVHDVLLDIFAYMDRRKFLAALAVTCKAFYEPAMDLLWAKIDGLEPLLGCVTRLHPLVYHRSKDFWETADVEPLSTDEAREFLRHSARIRSLVSPRNDNRFASLFSVIPVELCIWPRLQQLFISNSNYRALLLFLSPTLRCCSVYHWHEDDEYHAIPRALSLLSDRVQLCKELETLSCPTLDWAAWKHLSNLPTLTGLTVNVRRIHGTPPWLVEPHDMVIFSPFLHLTSLSFTGDCAAYATTILQHLQIPSLKSFFIQEILLVSTEAERLFRALSHCKQTLEELTVIFRECHDPQRNALTVISHLLSFTQLRTLQLCAMSAWPHIHRLRIEDFGFRSSATVTFRGLFTAIRQCPQLESLQLLIDTFNIDIDPDAEPIQHTSFKRLDLETSYSYIGNAEVVARIIFNWFPCVDEVSKYMNNSRLWKEVNEHLTSMRTATALHAIGAALNT